LALPQTKPVPPPVPPRVPPAGFLSDQHARPIKQDVDLTTTRADV